MPSLGADMDEGTLVEWLVSPGDSVHKGDIVAVVDTAKAAIEVEVFADGVVEALLVDPGTTVAVGTPLATLAGDGAATRAPEAEPPPPAAAEPAPETPRKRGRAKPKPPPEPAATEPGPTPAVASPIVRHLAHERGVDLSSLHGSGPHGEVTRADLDSGSAIPQKRGTPGPESAPQVGNREGAGDRRVKASPMARRRAAELGVALGTVAGTGPDGVVSVVDVERAAAAAAPAGPPVSGKAKAAAKQAAMREAIGALMARSKREIPHYYLRTTIDMAAATTWLRERNAGRGVEERLVPAVLLLKAAAVAAREVPEVNGFYVDGAFERSEHVHLGVAVSLRGGGLVAPAIHDADRLTLDELMAGRKDVVARARSGRLRGSQMSDPTITVTNLGDQGVEEVEGVIYPPQVALVGFGRVVERPWAVDGLLGVHPVVVATLAADHRVSDGHRGGRYLAAVDALLQHPEQL
jgi:pyruvate dehydrogenase E2 component (dihydrolipoyllysine-residue acetyltransferase)